MSGSAFAVTHHALSSGAGRTSDGNGSHASTLKSPSYTKSVSWQHYPEYERTSGQADSPYPPRLLQLDIDCKVSEPSFIAQELLSLTKKYLAHKLFSFAVDACKTAIPIAIQALLKLLPSRFCYRDR
ncbi:hypothetical protein U4M36_27200 [Klebsiella pneumoniae]|nr:hypothetical protein [Klebsiella pneumoniae]